MIAAVVVGVLLVPGAARPACAASGESLNPAGIPWPWYIAPAGAVLALVFAFVFYKSVANSDPGDEDMQRIAAHVKQGAYAYLKRQYFVVAIFFVVTSAILLLMGLLKLQHQLVFVAFLTGGFFSGLAGFFGMKTATMASNRTTQGAKEGLDRGLRVAFRAGAVMGLTVVGLGLLDITMWFFALVWLTEMSLTEITVVMLCFGMGASSQALFARVGGGIFTKAADVGADLVGKVEAGIPEDDPRNPATIADNVGDNVGDVAGMGADLYESYCGSILATAALGVAAVGAAAHLAHQAAMVAAPMVIAGIGIALSVLGIYLVRTKENATMKMLLGSLGLGVNVSSVLIAALAGVVCYFLLGPVPGVTWWGVWISILAGLAAGIVIGKSTEYYTSYDFKPTQNVSRQAQTGPATLIISGIAEGMKSTWAALVTVIIATILAFAFAGGFTDVNLGLYGIGIAAVGMLATLGITLATDAYGPIADNAGGNAEMTGQEPEVRKRTDALDSLGNTTAATGKGFAIGSAALTALALLAAYVEEVRVGQNREAEAAVVALAEPQRKAVEEGRSVLYLGHGKVATTYAHAGRSEVCGGMVLGEVPESWQKGTVQQPLEAVRIATAPEAKLEQYMEFYGVTLMNPKVLCGMFAGVALAFVFCALTMKAVGRAAGSMVEEVRRQFREIPGIMERKAEPDYARCVDISTRGAQKEMVLPSLLALIVPVGAGLLLGVAGVMGLLAGGLVSGFALAIFMANAGGSWDNAKKWIEAGELGGKGSDNHKAAVVGDTVGDPFKDTSGPSLNILIKLMSMVSVVFAGLIVKFAPMIGGLLQIGDR
jgi:H(+)-translocating pyrophosphatase